MRARGAFTIVELLVVIAIISVLAAFLLPTLEAAADQSRGIVCCNNLRQIHLGIASYAADNRDYLIKMSGPTPWPYVAAYYTWHRALGTMGYLPPVHWQTGDPLLNASTDVHDCPSTDYVKLGTDYGINWNITQSPNLYYGDDWQRRISEIPRPSETYLVADRKKEAGYGIYLRGGQTDTGVEYRHANNTSFNVAFVAGNVAAQRLNEEIGRPWIAYYLTGSRRVVPWYLP